ncbi:hypothetical protein HBH61_030380 [Parastagonospora nodorum]|nr:hypothetical protein HBH61_030380 [Parastagonospora nodorum]
MKPSHPRLTCRAHNRFSPSIALWHHFVGRDRPFLTQQRPSSTVAETSQHSTSDHVGDTESQATDGIVPPANRRDSTVRKTFSIRRLETEKGAWHANPIDASVARNREKKRIQSVLQKHRADSPMGALATAKESFGADKDYKGIVVQPVVHPTPVKESEFPWSLPLEEREIPGLDRLAIEIERFCAYSQPGHYETIARRQVIEQVKSQTRRILPDHVLEIFGSERTGLTLATSDIDLRLVKKAKMKDPEQSKLLPTSREREEATRDLYMLYGKIRTKHKSAYLLLTIRNARYPLISLQDHKSGLDVQVVLSNDTSLSRDLMKGYMEQYPYLRQLHLVVKTMFDVRGLTDVFRGGFGSYTLFMMIVASIRHKPHPRNDAAGGLINFMKFYRDLDTTKEGLSIEPVSTFNKVDKPIMSAKAKTKLDAGKIKPLPEYMLCLRDPADPTNDLGRKAIAIKHVQKTLKALYYTLDRDVRMNTRISLLSTLIGPSYMLYKERRHKLAEYGKLLSDKNKKRLAVQAREVRESTKSLESSPSEGKEENELDHIQQVVGEGAKPVESSHSAPKEENKLENIQQVQENIQQYVENIQQDLESMLQDKKQEQESKRPLL